jgi:signal transduction histidine kinase
VNITVADAVTRVPRPARIAAQEIVVVGVSLGCVLLSHPTGFTWAEPAAILACLALPLRLRWPWLAMLCCLAGLAGQLGLPPTQVALYRIGRTARSPRVTIAWIILAVLAIESTVVAFNHVDVRDGTMSVLFASLWMVSPAALGTLVTTRERLAASVAELRLAREAELETRAERARLAERARIGREIHDAVGHHATLIAVEAAALEATSGEPETKDMAQRIRSLAKASLGEMRSALGLLDGTAAGGLPDVAALVAQARQAGMAVHLTQGPLQPAAPAVGRAVFRIVQESLTNAAKHAPDTPVAVTITDNGQLLSVTVTSGPPAAIPAQDTGGLGLTGMAERAASVGGHLEAERQPSGTFTVRVQLPLDGRDKAKVDTTEPTIDGTEATVDSR